MFDGTPLVDLPLRSLLSAVLISSTLLVMFPVPVLAWGWQDLWFRRDQQAAQALQKGDFPRAMELAEDPLRKGAAAYRQGDYQQALETFSQAQGAQAHYNRGNALAQLGRLEEARDAYQTALDEQPGFEDARINRDLVEELLRQQQQQEQQQNSASDSEEQNSSQQESSEATDDTASNTPEAEDNAATQDQPSNTDSTNESGEQQDSDSESATSEQAQEEADAEQRSAQDAQAEQQSVGESAPSASDQQPDGEQPQTMLSAAQDSLPTEEQQAMDQWLERIPDDPGGLLRRKFLYQYRSRGPQATDPNAPAW